MQTTSTQINNFGADSGAQSIVVVRNLSKTYSKGDEVLHGIDMHVKAGELFGLIGPDGAGKTTIMQILSGVLAYDEGTVQIAGKEARHAHKEIGYVTQQFSLYPDLSIEENLRYIAGMHDVSHHKFEERKERFLSLTGLSRFADRLARQLSGGMKQKLALCCALITQPKLLLLDEPTSGVDPVSRKEFWDLVKEFASEGTATIAATAYFDEAELCDRVALVYEGRIERCGSPADLKKSMAVKRLQIYTKDPAGVELLLRNNLAKNQVQSENQKNQKDQSIIDLYSLGSRVDVIATDIHKAESAIRSSLSQSEYSTEEIRPAKLSMENVFLLSLLQKGHRPKQPFSMPRIKNDGLRSRKAESSALGDKHGYENKPDNTQIAIEARKLCKSFGDFDAVKNLDLKVAYGEIYGLLGANGAGKTTTIQMLCGLYEITDGQVFLAGKQPKLNDAQLRKKIGYMSQKFTLYPDLSVIENLEFFSTIYGVSRKHRKEKIDWVIDACGLQGQENDLIANMPGGWRQRVAFGASVMHEPEILFLDEPTSGVDPVARRELWHMIRDFARQGTAIIVSTHFLDEAEYCNRLGLMVDGDLIIEDSPEQLKTRENTDSLEEAFIKQVRRAKAKSGKNSEDSA